MYQRLRNYLKQSAFVLALLAGSGSFLQAQNWDKVIKAAAGDRNGRTSSKRSQNDFYGNSVAVSGDYAVVGAYGEDEDENGYNTISSFGYAFSSAGAAYILKRENGVWRTIKKICADLRGADDNFGISVAISGDYVVVGAPQEDEDVDGSNYVSDAGAAYIFSKNQGGIDNWGFVKKIVASNRGVSDNFGAAVAISGSNVVVSASKEDFSSLQDAGAVYIFEKDAGGLNNWGLQKRIISPSPAHVLDFGYSLSITNDYLLVGVPAERTWINGDELIGAGAAYLYKKDSGGAGNWGEVKKFTAPSRAAFDGFGAAVALSEGYVVIGASNEDNDENESNFLSESGSVYVFKKTEGGVDNWGQIKKIVSPERERHDTFGSAVAINGDVIAVGAILEDHDHLGQNYIENAGAVFLFSKDIGGADKWGHLKKIVAPIRNNLDYFGYDVAIDGGTLFVSTPRESEDELETNTIPFAGSAYIFTDNKGGVNNWGFSQKSVTMEEGEGNDTFGSAVSISGNYAVIGAYTDDDDSDGLNHIDYAGSVYIFYNNGGVWTQVKKLTAPNRSTYAYYGASVSIDGDYLIVGSFGEGNRGAAYLYKRNQGGENNWGLVQRLVSFDGSLYDYFGVSVSINNGYAVVGASGNGNIDGSDLIVNRAGAAYIYKENNTNTWSLVKKVTSMNRAEMDSFGGAVSIYGDYLIVGATGEDEDINESNYLSYAGAAYVFKKDKWGADNWGQIKKLIAPNRLAGAYFGQSVAIENEYLVVGAHQESAAYIFKKDDTNDENWLSAKKILPPSASVPVNFGYSVSLSGENVIVSAHGDQSDNSGSNPIYMAGAAHIFNKNSGGLGNWGHVKKLTSPIRSYADQFGMYVAISGNQAVVGSPNDDQDTNEQNFLTNAGSVYFFERACSEPLTLASSNITNKTVTISWAEPLSVPAGGYEYYYSTSSSTPADNVTINGSTSAGVTSANLNGLQPATTYYFWVRSSCSVGYASVWVAGSSFTTDACPATIAELTIPTEVGTYQSVNTIQEGNLTHYCDCANNLLLLSLDKTGSGAVIPDNGIKVKVGGGASYYTNGTGFVTNTHGTAMFNRWWSVTPTTQPTVAIKVRTYYATEDYTAVNSTLTTNGKAPMGSESQLFFYKVTDPSLGEFPAVSTIGTDKVVLITNGLSAGLGSWIKGTFGEDSYAEFFVSSFSGGGGGGSPSEALPVTLVSFHAKKNEQEVHLSWSTSSESNTSYFAIERSSDGRVWNKIGEEQAAGKSTGLKNYTYRDVRPFSGKNYYRLRTIDRDGTFALSRIEQVTFSGERTLVLYPNPVSDKLYIKGVGEISSVSIVNGLGQVVLQTSGFPKEGIAITQLSSGLYSVQLNRADGSSQYYKVVVIK